MRAQRTVVSSHAFVVAFSSPPTYWIGFWMRGSRGSSSGKTDSTFIATQLTGDPACGRIPHRGPSRQPEMSRNPGVIPPHVPDSAVTGRPTRPEGPLTPESSRRTDLTPQLRGAPPAQKAP